MAKEEIQEMLDKFGFTIALNKTLNGVNRTHMIHRGDVLSHFVEYYVNDMLNTIESIWAYRDSKLELIETLSDFEIWLNQK